MEMRDERAINQVGRKYRALQVVLDERARRQWAAAEAMSMGWGGISAVAEATCLDRNTITTGVRELEDRIANPGARVSKRIRIEGGGRKSVTEQDPGLTEALDRLIDPMTRGHPETGLRWTCKSTAKLAEELSKSGHPLSDRTVAHLLKEDGYSLQANHKTQEGSSHPDRNRQFEHIHQRVQEFQKQNQPVVSVDAKKKELVGNFKNPGREWQPSKHPIEVNTYDFPDPDVNKAVPYGVYDLANNEGWVSVGINHDTAQFAVASLNHWWSEMGQQRFPRASELMITADGGGSNNYRNRLWKITLQKFATETGLTLHVCHFPPGTSKWNKIEHRLFCHITKNWRGRPLTSYEVIVNLIANTTTEQGLVVRAEIDPKQYERGIKVTDHELAQVRLEPNPFHGEWNYAIKPIR